MKRFLPLALAGTALVVAAILFHPTAAPGGAAGWLGRMPDPLGHGAAARDDAGATGWSTTAAPAQPKPRRTAAPPVVVYVAGAVRHPGVYTVAPGARVGDALARAGGGRPDADLVAVNLAAHLHDGDEIAVPLLGADPPGRAPANGAAGHRKRGAIGAPARSTPVRSDTARSDTGRGGRRAHRTDPPPPDSVDLNRADATTLQTLPGVGPALAARIVLFRQANGPFGSIDELLDVSGITERRLDLISPYLEVR